VVDRITANLLGLGHATKTCHIRQRSAGDLSSRNREKDGGLTSQPMTPDNAMFHVVFIKKDFGGSLGEVDGFGLLAKAAVAAKRTKS